MTTSSAKPIRLAALAALSTLVLLLAACGTTESGGTDGGTDGGTGGDGTPISTGTAADVLEAANAFLATLDSTQKASVVIEATQENAVQWSNLPTSLVERNGIQFSTLTEAQLTAAQAVVQAALGTAQNNGYDEVTQILAADDVLAAAGGARISPQQPGGGGGLEYGAGLYYLAFLGTPSATGTWQLQFGGHHLVINLTYAAGSVTGVTPEFVGVEPLSWTTDGTTYAPLADEQGAMVALLAGLSTEQLATAQLSETFSDVLLGPGEDRQFPTTKEGLAVSSLSAEQQALVLAAIATWVQDVDDTTAAAILEIYEAELDETYIAFSGNATLTNSADYVRIDGPSVWIEFVCQNGIVYADQIHYHTVWRDRERDYGAQYSF